MKAAFFLLSLTIALLALSGCARVHQKDREFLSDPIMQRSTDPMADGMESHNLPRREGAVGGSSGSGGGCGC
ncbi:MAG: hypothetical protein JWO30_4961 [Fibrobacteres bacterium]|nr:hypothetical protein [Fibrobacterota bacterium]